MIVRAGHWKGTPVSTETASAKPPRFSSPGLKLLAVALLTAVMIIPLFIIGLALDGREERSGEAVADVASGWGATQVVSGPVIFVPYDYQVQSVVDGKTVVTTQHDEAVVLPNSLTIDAKAATETRWRGIFEVPVYRSAIAMEARFTQNS